LSACQTEAPDDSEASERDWEPSTSSDVIAEDPGGSDPADTGEAEEEAEEDEPLRLEGQMDVEYTYTGSLGEFSDTCAGDAFIVIDADGVLDGEGTCANAVITFNFTIDGSRDASSLSGVLIGESAAGRAETPFSGELADEQTELRFDHTHEADGEALRLVGTMSLASSE